MTIYYGSIAHLLMGKNQDTTSKSKQQPRTTKKKRSGTDSTQVRQRKKANNKEDNSKPGSGPMMDILYSMTQVSLVKTDSIVFRLHCNATVILLVTFSIAVTTRQYVGNPIDCVHTRDIPEEVLNTYCWIHSTYIVESAILKKVGKEVAYPGVDNSKMSKGPVRHVKYYQWVAFMLFFQNFGFLLSVYRTNIIRKYLISRTKTKK